MRTEEVKYKVVITTNTFATFERELCAYVTGQIGQCNTGIEHRFKADEEVKKLFEDAMERRQCIDDYWRPVQASSKDGNAFELYFKVYPTKEMIDLLVEGCKLFADEQKKKYPITTKINVDEVKIVTERTIIEELEEICLDGTFE